VMSLKCNRGSLKQRTVPVVGWIGNNLPKVTGGNGGLCSGLNRQAKVTGR
jgi:hypothetical protein